MILRTEPQRMVRIDGTQEWYADGKLHRLDGPAIIWAYGSQEWWVEGSLHRLDGPASTWTGGSQWWVEGKRYRDEESHADAVIRYKLKQAEQV